MARTISSTAREENYKQETSQVWVVLVEIDEDSLPAPIRVALNYEDITHDGDVYTGTSFDIRLPEDADNKIGQITIAIQNVDREIVEAVRTAAGAPTVTTKVVLAASPNTVEQGPYEWKLRRAQYNELIVSGAILADDVRNEPYPGYTFTPSIAPGLF